MKKYRCPVFRRRSFYQDREYFLSNTAGEAVQLEKYIREETNYDINYVWENMLRTCHQNDLVETLALQYILPTDYEIPYSTGQSKVSLMYIFWMYWKILLGGHRLCPMGLQLSSPHL